MKKLFNIKESTLPKVPTYPEDNRIIDYIINNMYNSKIEHMFLEIVVMILSILVNQKH